MGSSILFIVIAASGVAITGFLLGLSKNIIIDKENAIKTAIEYDCNIIIKDLIISMDKLSAIATSNKGFVLFKTMGKQISSRIIEINNIKINGENILFNLNDIGFPNFKAQFSQSDIDVIFKNITWEGVENA